jgi:hypothetical protein
MSVPAKRLLKIVCSSFREPEIVSPIRTGSRLVGSDLRARPSTLDGLRATRK